MAEVDSRKAFAIAVFGGLIIGKLIKKFAFGMLIGILLALLYVLMRSAPGKKQNNVRKSDSDMTTQAGWLFAYAGIVVFLVVLIFFFYHFTRYFA
jgi:lysylphosphatidylglycerol synthetase-like protein (DUF2156 family)